MGKKEWYIGGGAEACRHRQIRELAIRAKRPVDDIWGKKAGEKKGFSTYNVSHAVKVGGLVLSDKRHRFYSLVDLFLEDLVIL
jgi:hypothetical protein